MHKITNGSHQTKMRTTGAYCFRTGRMIRFIRMCSSKPIQLHPKSLGGEKSCPLL